jgi:hypothetical protein
MPPPREKKKKAGFPLGSTSMGAVAALMAGLIVHNGRAETGQLSDDPFTYLQGYWPVPAAFVATFLFFFGLYHALIPLHRENPQGVDVHPHD